MQGHSGQQVALITQNSIYKEDLLILIFLYIHIILLGFVSRCHFEVV